MKRVLLPLLGAMAVMLVVAAVAGGHDWKGHKSVELVGTDASFNFVDADPKQASETEPPSPGDELLISETITKDGHDFGSLYIECTYIVADVTQCAATLDLPNGQITAQGVVHQGSFEGQEVANFDQVVTGGTGDYAGVGGTVHVLDAAEDGVPSIYHLELR